MVPVAFVPSAQAQVAVGIGVGGYGGYGAAPVCEYGYYNSAPYACAPYGYYGPEWFDGGLFIGVGPWYRGYGYGGYGFRGGYGFPRRVWLRRLSRRRTATADIVAELATVAVVGMSAAERGAMRAAAHADLLPPAADTR